MKTKKFFLTRIFVQWFESADNAIEGILYATKYQRHIKFHLFSAFIVLLLCFMIGVKKDEFIIITFITLLVIVAEMFNSSLEAVVDISSPKKNEIARIAKDIASGAVLVSSIGAIIIGYLILWPYIIRIFNEGFKISKHQAENIAVLAVIIVMLIIIVVKAYFGRGRPLRGGFPSGHSAIAFSIWISVTKMTLNKIILIFVLIVAILISLNQLLKKIHFIWDIIMGAVTGMLITLLLFWIFY